MSEEVLGIAWDAAAQIRMSLEICVAGWFLYRLMTAFFPRGRSAAIGAAYAGALLVLYWIPPEMTSAAAYLLALGAACATSFWLVPPGERLLAMLMCVVLYALRVVSASVAGAVYGSLYSALVLSPSAAGDPARQFGMFALAGAAEVALFTFLLFLAVRAVSRAWPVWHRGVSLREFALLAMPCAAALSVYYALGYFGLRVDYEADFVRLEWISGALMGAQFVVIVGSVMQFAAVLNERRRAERRDALEAQTLALRRHVGTLEELYASLRSFRHDAANHLETIAALKASDPAQAAAYAEACRERLEERLPTVRSGNPVTDVILSAQALRAERGRIRFSCDFHYPPDASFDPFDIAVILHNAGANALEAALRTEDPFIRIRSRKRGRAFFIEYANSCSGPLTEDPATGRARSAKKDAEHHGVGLENVVGAAEIYGGACEIWTEGRTCFLTVLLNDAPSRD